MVEINLVGEFPEGPPSDLTAAEAIARVGARNASADARESDEAAQENQEEASSANDYLVQLIADPPPGFSGGSTAAYTSQVAALSARIDAAQAELGLGDGEVDFGDGLIQGQRAAWYDQAKTRYEGAESDLDQIATDANNLRITIETAIDALQSAYDEWDGEF